MNVSPVALGSGFRLITLQTTSSTNDEALAMARAGDEGRLWIVADEQTKGRGRHGRVWASPRGNLYASLLLVAPCEQARASQLGFVAALALHDAVADVTGLAAPRLALKWPNDLLVDGAKLSGILLEGHRVGATQTFAVIIGMGVNVTAAPEGMPYRTTRLIDAAGAVDRAALFAAMSSRMARRLAEWQGGAGFDSIREAWLARAARLGANVTVRLPHRNASGTFLGVDSAGRLILDGPVGREAIDAGDLFFGSRDDTSDQCVSEEASR